MKRFFRYLRLLFKRIKEAIKDVNMTKTILDSHLVEAFEKRKEVNRYINKITHSHNQVDGVISLDIIIWFAEQKSILIKYLPNISDNKIGIKYVLEYNDQNENVVLLDMMYSDAKALEVLIEQQVYRYYKVQRI